MYYYQYVRNNLFCCTKNKSNYDSNAYLFEIKIKHK